VTAAFVSIDDLVRIDEVADAEFYVGDLFRGRFGGDPPDYPKHFVAWYRAARNSFVALGYLHCTVEDDLCLCGGVVEDERAIGRMPAPQQHALRASGGLAARLLRDACASLPSMPAFWACVGEPRLRETFLAAQFEALDHPYLMVRWNAMPSTSARNALVERVVALGPF
jgi:hypothetical protein